MFSFDQARPPDFTIVKNDSSLKVFIRGVVVSGAAIFGIEGAEGRAFLRKKNEANGLCVLNAAA